MAIKLNPSEVHLYSWVDYYHMSQNCWSDVYHLSFHLVFYNFLLFKGIFLSSTSMKKQKQIKSHNLIEFVLLPILPKQV